jgi:pyrimidine deaminase RibD-like protein
MNDSDFMQLALLESKKALPKCTPNPPVGCVLVKNGEVVASGFTQPIGGNHAEVEAIREYTGNLDGVTAYVTLEPCAFEGRTPSCAKMLADSDISIVNIAVIDPDPRNSGKGIEILKNAGIKVNFGIENDEVTAFISQYLGKS